MPSLTEFCLLNLWEEAVEELNSSQHTQDSFDIFWAEVFCGKFWLLRLSEMARMPRIKPSFKEFDVFWAEILSGESWLPCFSELCLLNLWEEAVEELNSSQHTQDSFDIFWAEVLWTESWGLTHLSQFFGTKNVLDDN